MKPLVAALALTVASVIPVAARADDRPTSNFYAGATIGTSKLSVTSSAFDGEGKTDETGYKLFGGYRLTDFLSVEAAYYYTGKFHEEEIGVASLSLEGNVVEASLLAGVHIGGPVSLFGRVGVVRWDTKLTAFAVDVGGGTLNDHGTDLNYGIGVNIDCTDHVAVRFEADQTKIDAPIGDIPFDWRLRFFQLGALYKF